MLFFKMNSFYIVTLIIIILCFLYILIFYTFLPLIKQNKAIKKLKRCLSDNNINFEIIKSKGEFETFTLKTNDVNYLVKIVDVKKGSDLVINTNKELLMYYKNIVNENKAKMIDGANLFISLNKTNKIIMASLKINSVTLYKNEKEATKLSVLDAVNNTYFINVNDIIQIIKK